MYCSTCGAHVPEGRTHCAGCGAAVFRAPVAYGGGTPAVPATAHVCRRCGYTGEGVAYFSRGSHVAGLVFLALLSMGFLGAFALVYYFSHHDHRICPRCGKDWGKHPSHLPVPQGAAPAGAQAALLPAGGSAKQGFSVALFVLAALLVLGGIVGLEAGPVVLGIGAGVGGWLLRQSARQEREARRQALLSSLQLPVLKLAAERQGRLTVTEVAAALGWTLPRAEKVLNSLDDGLRVSSEVTDEGVIVYEFRELVHTPRLQRLRGEPAPPP
jgi:ribosomal protein L40E